MHRKRTQKLRNPLRARVLREIKGDAGRYAVIFLLLVFMIGFVSGFLVADNSMIIAYNEGFQKYNIEDGHFRTEARLNRSAREKAASYGISIYENNYFERETDNGSRLRIYHDRTDVDLVCLMSGAMPKHSGEIAIDRLYAQYHHIAVGDAITLPNTADDSSSASWTVTGFVALPDYSCLFENNSDSMFDAEQFGVAIVSQDGFASFPEDTIFCNYAWKYLHAPASDEEKKDAAEDLMQNLNTITTLRDFVPAYTNNAIIFTGNDMGGDRTMIIILLYIIIAILAFVFAITTSDTIRKESNVIGTLRALGYTRSELIRHYMTAPLFITLIGALAGNILGYTVFKYICAEMYYNSYSLPTYVTVWNMDAFIDTTVVPLLLMACINYIVLRSRMKLSPIKYLRRELSRGGKHRAVSLPHRLPFFARFRMRVLLQNISSYVVLLIGVLFANFLLLFGMMMPEVLHNYQEKLRSNMLCNYQYILTIPSDAMDENQKLISMMRMFVYQLEMETDNPDAEKFSAYSLKTTESDIIQEDVMFYGVQTKSKYVDIPDDNHTVYVSSAYAEKYNLQSGDVITLKEEYEDTSYSFTVTGIYPYEGGISVFMPQVALNDRFDLGEDYYSGYFSDTEITDIDSQYIGTVINYDSLTKVSRQLMASMGNIMYLVDAISIIIFIILVYLLSKIIIEKNTQAISMTKILGYWNREISRIYLLPTSIAYTLFLVLSVPLENRLMRFVLLYYIRTSMSGWIEYEIRPVMFLYMILLGIAAYVVVAVIEFRRIRRIPMDQALKNVE